MSLTPQADGHGTSGGSCAHLWQLAASHPRLSPPHVSAKFTSLYVLGSMVTVAQGTVWPPCGSTLPSTKDLTHTLPLGTCGRDFSSGEGIREAHRTVWRGLSSTARWPQSLPEIADQMSKDTAHLPWVCWAGPGPGCLPVGQSCKDRPHSSCMSASALGGSCISREPTSPPRGPREASETIG